MRGRDRLASLAVHCQLAVVLSASLVMRTVMAQSVGPSANHSKDSLLTIVNPKRRDVPEQKVRFLFVITCEVVAQEFHRDASETEFRLTLVLGERDEHYTIAPDGALTLYLNQWNDGKFVDGVISGAVQHLTAPQIRKRMSSEILRRSENVSPVAAKDLRALHNRTLSTGSCCACISAIRDEPCPWTTQPH